jgi:hypothetical protein
VDLPIAPSLMAPLKGRLPALFGAMVLVICGLTAAGWILKEPALLITFGTPLPLPLDAALLFSLISIWLMIEPFRSSARPRAVRAVCGAAMLLTGLILAELVFSVDLGI